ncbi:MAG TPA: HAD-IA family hydrolase [Candidatus Saccharimonadales bacterium]|nr:HAD-IA family hydrolase [Candidatus Saccharimonadales bacterium]
MAAIIFDFDGTIADSFDYVVDLLATAAGREPLTPDQQAELRGLSMAAIGRQFGHSWPRLFWLFVKGRKRMTSSISHIKPFVGMPELIEKLHAEGHELFIVSTNTVRNVRTFLRQQDLHKYFLEIYGGVGLFSKAPALRKLLREQHIEKDSAIYIGDELRDIEAAQSVGLRVIGVSWGFARTSDLSGRQPFGLADTPAELLKLLEEI